MSKVLNVEVPINSLSFGNVAVNILHEFWKKKVDCNIFLIGQQPDFSAFDKLPDEFKAWVVESMNKALGRYKTNDPVFKIWHINGAQNKVANNQFLFTFHELDRLTPFERNILENQTEVFVSSQYTQNIINSVTLGIKANYIPLGFDSNHFHVIAKRQIPENVISLGVLAKFESRKHSARVIELLVNKYGNNPGYVIHAAVYNPFFSPEQNKQIQMQLSQGDRIWNINFLPFVKTNSEYNSVLNSIDIVLDVSGAEAWSLPSFQAACIGKHGVLLDCAGASSWAQESGFELIDPVGKKPVYDNVFFQQGTPFNQGEIFEFSNTDLERAIDTSIHKFKKDRVNHIGRKMVAKYTWENTAEQILAKIF